MAHVSYPVSFPTECVGDLIAIGRGGWDQIIANKSEVGLHFWNLQGWGQATLLGNPDGPFTAMSATDEADLIEELDELREVFRSCCADRVSASGISETKSVFADTESFGVGGRIQWAKVIAFIKQVMPLILLFLETDPT